MRQSAILDIGSSKVICMAVGSGSDGAIIVHGMGVVQYAGHRADELPPERELSDAIREAIEEAQTEAQHRIREVCVGVPSPFMRVVTCRGEAETAGRDGRVDQEDVDFLLESSLSGNWPEGYSLIHSTPSRYLVDGTAISGSPIGLPAQKLAATVSHCYVEDAYKELVTRVLRSMGIEPDMFVSTALATAYFTVPDEVRAGRALIVDCGGSHTDVCLVEENALCASETIPMGGRHFTSDLCFGLRLPESIADDLKKRYVFGLDYGESSELVRIPGEGVFEIEHSVIQLILESRAEELCELIGEACSGMTGAETPVWLVGGGLALMRGSADFLAKLTGRTVNTTLPFMSRTTSVGYAAAFGLADFVLYRCGRTNALKSTGRRLMRQLQMRL